MFHFCQQYLFETRKVLYITTVASHFTSALVTYETVKCNERV